MFKRCYCSVSSPPPPVVDPPGSCKNCLHIPSLVLQPDESVSKCFETAEIDLLEHANVEVCSENGTPCGITWYILKKDEVGIFGATINAGILSFTTNTTATPGEYYKISIKASCNCTQDEKIFEVNIGIKDLCKNQVCDCDPCTGLCIEES